MLKFVSGVLQRLNRNQQNRAYALPSKTRIYAVGDIHGCSDLLKKMQSRIYIDAAEHEDKTIIVVYLGDYIDRGPDSYGVVENLCRPAPAGINRICLMGNHDQTMLRFLNDASVLEEWKHFGGLTTLHSYNVTLPRSSRKPDIEEVMHNFVDAVPTSHKDFLMGLNYQFECGDYMFVHAGIRPGVRLEAQNEHDLLWIRDEFLSSTRLHGKYIVHGHTPVSSPELYSNRANIDIGAYHTGKLCCLVIDGQDKSTIVVTNED